MRSRLFGAFCALLLTLNISPSADAAFMRVVLTGFVEAVFSGAQSGACDPSIYGSEFGIDCFRAVHGADIAYETLPGSTLTLSGWYDTASGSTDLKDLSDARIEFSNGVVVGQNRGARISMWRGPFLEPNLQEGELSIEGSFVSNDTFLPGENVDFAFASYIIGLVGQSTSPSASNMFPADPLNEGLSLDSLDTYDTRFRMTGGLSLPGGGFNTDFQGVFHR